VFEDEPGVLCTPGAPSTREPPTIRFNRRSLDDGVGDHYPSIFRAGILDIDARLSEALSVG
jgi:hypothetical protein